MAEKEPRERSIIFVVPSDRSPEERNLLKSVKDGLKRKEYVVDEKTVEDNQKEVEKLGKIEEYLNMYEKIVLVFSRHKESQQLMKLLTTNLQHIVEQNIRKKCYVYTIIWSEDYKALPSELHDFNIRRFLVSIKEGMQPSEHCAGDIIEFLGAEPDNINLNLTCQNFGNGLAWSLYIGYLSHMLPGLKSYLENTQGWYKGEGNPSKKKISTRMLIYPKTESDENKSERMIIHEHEEPKDVASVDRKYEADVREVRSPGGDESYFGVADFANCLKVLIGMRDDKPMSGEFFKMSEDDMNKQGQYFYKRLKLILDGQKLENLNGLMYGNEKDKYVDPSMFKLMEFKDIKPATLDEQANFLFEDLRMACLQNVEVMDREQTPSDEPTPDTGVLLLSEVEDDVKQFVGEFKPSSQHESLTAEQANELVGKSKNIFLVLTDTLILSADFEDLFYNILQHGYKKNNRRFLVCLDCRSPPTNQPTNQPALGLLVLFKRISYLKEGWQELVKAELKGDPQEIGHSLLMRNVGTGFALSYYYQFLRIRFPAMKTLVKRTPGLEDKVKEGRMSYKLFVLLPKSHQTTKKLSQADRRIKNKEEDDEVKNFELPDIKHGRRKYTPQLHSIEDTEENGRRKYLAFVEYNTQSNTLLEMKKTGVMDEDVFAQESEDFINKLRAIVDHKNEPAGLKHWLRFIEYDDQKKGFSLADYILAHVKCEIRVENGRLPVVKE